jgi:hypothetical protein
VSDTPALRVLRGAPSDEEVAALVSVLAAASTRRPQVATASPARSRWADAASGVRRPLTPGPGAWRAAAQVSG